MKRLFTLSVPLIDIYGLDTGIKLITYAQRLAKTQNKRWFHFSEDQRGVISVW